MLFCSLSTVLCSFYVCSLYIRSLQKIKKKIFKEQIFLLSFLWCDYFCVLVFLSVQQTSLQAPRRNSEKEGVKVLCLTGLLKQLKTNINALSNIYVQVSQVGAILKTRTVDWGIPQKITVIIWLILQSLDCSIQPPQKKVLRMF